MRTIKEEIIETNKDWDAILFMEANMDGDAILFMKTSKDDDVILLTETNKDDDAIFTKEKGVQLCTRNKGNKKHIIGLEIILRP